MSHPRVVNRHRTEAWDVYVGRAPRGWPPSPWGNPFTLEDHGAAAMRLYLDHLEQHPELVERARTELAGKVLACWCAPRLCHGEALARLADGEALAEIRRDLLLLVGETRDLFGGA